MTEGTWLPVQVGGNARWVVNSPRTELAKGEVVAPATPELVGMFVGIPIVAGGIAYFFPVVPDDQLWTFDRITFTSFEATVELVIVLFLDDDRTSITDAAFDTTRWVDGVWPAQPLEVISRPSPLQVVGGSRLGVVFVDFGNPGPTGGALWVHGTARAEITSYKRPPP